MIELHVFLQQLVGADDDIGFTLQHAVQRQLRFFGGLKAGQYIHFHRPFGKAVGEVLIVLLCQQSGGH